jgi:hypothetical protein
VPVAFVVPCLNEEADIEATTASLGFGNTEVKADEDVFLILVDNGSTDRTPAIMERIASASRPGSVRILVEPEKGFVPPRRRGAFAVGDLAAELGIATEQFLILQADADTLYLPGYARHMWTALDSRQGLLLEGASKRTAEFDDAHPEYRVFEKSIDDALEAAGVADDEEVVVDDKACGFLLSDYLRWGGHFREYDRLGGTVHAETTRLFLRARLAHGAAKVRVNPAQVQSSRRRIEEEPALHFATHGFPREDAWVKAWRERHPTQWTVDEFAKSANHPEVQEACFYRGAHEIALFALLPWVLARTTDPEGFHPRDKRADRLLPLVPHLSVAELVARPARALTAVLNAIDEHPTAFRTGG